MLSPRLTNCVDCTTIPALLADIDCKLNELSKELYNNVVFMLNKQVSSNVILDLSNYKRILTYKYCNPEYAAHYTVQMIASRVKLLVAGCVKGCTDCDSASPASSITTTTTTTTVI